MILKEGLSAQVVKNDINIKYPKYSESYLAMLFAIF
jgi:hypothetical protein